MEGEELRQSAPVRGADSAVRVSVLLLPSWVAMAWLVSEAQWFWNNRPDLQFGWIVLLLCSYIVWEGFESRPSMQLRCNVSGILIGALGLLLLVVFQVYRMAFGTTPAALCFLAAGVMLLVGTNLSNVFGPVGIRHFGFGFIFLLIALPLPSVLYLSLITGLQNVVAMLNVEILNLVGIPARRTGSLILLPSCTVGVDEACSGIRSLQSTLMATLFIGYLSLRHITLKILLVAAGVLLAILGNLVRSLFLSYTANTKGLAALQEMHDKAGWSILLFTAVGVGALAWMLGRVEKASGQTA